MAEKTTATELEFSLMLAEVRQNPPAPTETTEQIANRMAGYVKERRGLKAGLIISSALAADVLRAAGYEPGIPTGWLRP